MYLKKSVSILLVFILAQIVLSQSKTLVPNDLLRMKQIVETAISPDGRYFAYTVLNPRPFEDSPGSNYLYLNIYDKKNKQSKELIGEKNSVSNIRWSSDSKTIYFSSKMNDDKSTQIYSVSVEGGKANKLTSHESGVFQFEVSINGLTIAFTALEPISSKKKEFTDIGFDAEIYEEEYRDRNLYTLDLKSEEVKKITSSVSVFEFTWSPDNSNIAAAIADKNLVDDSYMFKRIYIIDITSGSKYKLVENPGKLSDLSFSPDGKHLAFVSASSINDAVSGSLFIAEVPNNKPFDELKNYSKGFEGSVISTRWKDNRTVLFSSEEGVDITLSEQGIDTKDRKILINPGQVVFRNFDVINDMITFAGSTPSHPAELYSFILGDSKPEKLTNVNPWLNDIKLAKQEKISYKAKDGLEIEAILIYPLNYNEGERYPLIADIHGGPESAEHNGWSTGYNSWGQFAAAKDFFVFLPNYRASSGRGVDFTMMGFGDLVGKEFDDVVDGIDYLIERGMVDKKRVGIGGGSYGGYFAAWGATKFTDRFAASVVFVGVTNQVSKRNTTDIPYEDYYVHWGLWTHENENLIWERSPVRYAHLSKTPTLILAGKEDPRVHPSQSLELYRALKMHSKAPVRLVFYPGQGHGNSKNTSRYDYLVRTLDWFEYYLKGKNPKDKLPEKYIEVNKELENRTLDKKD